MFGYILGVNVMVFTTHLAPNIMINPIIASGVGPILSLNILRECSL